MKPGFFWRRRHYFFLLHAGFLLMLTIMLQHLLVLYKDESTIIQLSTFLKMYLTPANKPDPNEFLFINTSYDNQLVDVFDETGFIPLGNQPITDREKLIEFLAIVDQYPEHKYLILDIFFEASSPADSSLESLLNSIPRNLSAHFLDNESQAVYPSLDVPTGYVSVRVINDEFTKFRLSESDSSYSLPLKAYLEQSNSSYSHGAFISWLDHRPILNTYFLNYGINTYDLKIAREYPLINLGELLWLGQENIQELIQNRWIVLGDFEQNDNIETLFGSIPGPLLLMNVILSLERKDARITVWYVLFLLLGYYFISSIVLNPHDRIGHFIGKLRFGEVIQNFLKGFALAIILSTISILSFFIFHIHVNILMLSLYLYGLDYLVIRLAKKSQLIVPEAEDQSSDS